MNTKRCQPGVETKPEDAPHVQKVQTLIAKSQVPSGEKVGSLPCLPR